MISCTKICAIACASTGVKIVLSLFRISGSITEPVEAILILFCKNEPPSSTSKPLTSFISKDMSTSLNAMPVAISKRLMIVLEPLSTLPLSTYNSWLLKWSISTTALKTPPLLSLAANSDWVRLKALILTTPAVESAT